MVEIRWNGCILCVVGGDVVGCVLCGFEYLGLLI